MLPLSIMAIDAKKQNDAILHHKYITDFLEAKP